MEHPALSPGDLLADAYRVERFVGGGAMGQVFAAVDVRTGARVAVKLMSIEFASGRDLDRFQREAELAARVDRKGGVVRVHATGVSSGRPYCVMEFVDGEDLDQVLRRGPLEPERACALLAEVARTLSACHAEGVIHRDLKPANIIIAKDGRPRVADFGLARDMTSDGLTRTGELVGTPAYMAPEQAMDAARAVTPAVDVYALGAVLYHTLTGEPPFSGPSVLQVLTEVANVEPTPPRALRSELPADVEAVCLRAMAKDPALRYPSMDELADDLERAVRGSQVTARPLTGLEGFSRRLRAGDLRSLLAVLLAPTALVLAALAVSSLVSSWRWRDAAPALLAEAEAFQREALAPWALGAGRGAPPAQEELRRLADDLEQASPHLSGAEGERAQALARRLRAQQRLLEDRLDPAQRPEGAVTDAVTLARRGEHDAALKRLALALRNRDELALTGWAAVWTQRLQDPARAGECLQALPRSGVDGSPEAERVVARATALLLEQAITAALPGDLGGLTREAKSIAGRLRRLGPLAAAVWSRARAEALSQTARAWVDRLRSSRPAEGATAVDLDPLQATLRALGELLRLDPPLELPAPVSEALNQLFREGLERLPQPGGDRIPGWWLSDLEGGAFYELGWRCPREPAYLGFLRGEMLIAGRPHPRRDVAVAAARNGVFQRHHKVFNEGSVEMFLVRARPARITPRGSAGLLWLDFERELHLKGSLALQSPHREELRALAREIIDAPRDDLSPPYWARVRHLYCRLLQDELSDLPRGERPAAELTALEEQARLLLSVALQEDQFRDVMLSLQEINERRGGDMDILALCREHLQRLERLADAGGDDPAARLDWIRALELRLSLGKVLEQGQMAEESHQLLKVAIQRAERIDAPTKLRQQLAFAASESLRELGHYDEADAAITPWLDEALDAKAEFVKEAVRVSLRKREFDEALRRLEVGTRFHGADRDMIQEARKEYQEALRRHRAQRKDGGE